MGKNFSHELGWTFSKRDFISARNRDDFQDLIDEMNRLDADIVDIVWCRCDKRCRPQLIGENGLEYGIICNKHEPDFAKAYDFNGESWDRLKDCLNL